ncbi:MAG: hypothetical protein ACI9C4_002500 [Paraglaciecola sp.]|jgi:hypothetical protein
MHNNDFETHLYQRLAELPREKQPERDLWQGVELALVKDVSSNSPVPGKLYLLAASFAVIAVLGWLSLSQPSNQLSGEDLVLVLDAQHQQQKNALLVKFKDQPALTQNWQQQLTELDEAAGAIKAALESKPNNMALLKMLQNVHQQQINVIQRVHSSKWSQI